MQAFNLRRIAIVLLLLISLGITIFIVYKAYQKDEWGTIASALSVVTAVLAIWTSITLTWRQEDEKQPNIILEFDTTTYRHATNLVIKNDGGSPAYNVSIKWSTELLDYDGDVVRFMDHKNEYDIYFLNNGSSYSRFVRATKDFLSIDRKEDLPLIYEGEISYSDNTKSKRRIMKPFVISLEHHRKSLDAGSDQVKFYSDNSDISKKLRELNDTLKNIMRQMPKKD